MPKKAERTYEDSELVSKGPCPDCPSSDGCATYTDGHTHCFVCGKTHGDAEAGSYISDVLGAGRSDAHSELASALAAAQVRALKSRGLTTATCEFWDYRTRLRPNGDYEQLAPYRDRETGELVGIKVRNVGADGTGKEFYWIGSAKDQLWGAHKWPAGGKKLTIIEGEIDTQTVSQANDHKWPVVSVPNGAHEAAKCIAKNLEYVSSFEEVLFGFDMDRQGREAAIECAKLLPPGKAKIVKWSEKDPNAMLTGGKGKEITLAVFKAEPYRPDGVIDARELTQACLAPVVTGIPWPWQFMTDWTYGRRPAETYVFGAGTGIGKTDILAEIIASTISGTTKDNHASYEPQGFAIFAYEAGAATTKKAVAGKLAGKRFHIPMDDDGFSWTMEDLTRVMQDMDQRMWGEGGKLFINDSLGAADWDAVVERARYLHHAEGICHFLVDPISALVTEEEDERKFLDHMVLQAAKLGVELNSNFYLSSHLARPKEGPSHEEGGHVRLSQFRGSNAIGMFSNFVFGCERDQQSEEEDVRAVMTMRVLKDRFTGNAIGKTARVVYDAITGSYDVPVTKFLGDDQ